MKKHEKIVIVLLSVAIALLFGLFIFVIVSNFSTKAEEPKEKAVAKISLETRNVKSEFYIGEPFSTQGLGITVTYVDGTEELVLPSDVRCNVIAPNITKVGFEEVLVNFGNYTESYTISVSRIDGLLLDLSNVNLVYDVSGDTGDEEEGFKTDGLRVYLLTSSAVEGSNDLKGFERELDISEYKVSEPDLSEPGSKTVTVEYIKASVECKAAFEVCVTPKVDSLSKLNFNSLNGNELTLYITERSGGGNASEDGSASGWYLLKRADGTCSMYDMTMQYSSLYQSSTYGGNPAVRTNKSQSEVEITVDGVTFSITLSGFNSVALGWPREVLGYELYVPTEAKEYVVGSNFSTEGVKVVVRYSDNGTQEADGTLTVLTTPNMNEIGVKNIDVKFTDENGTQHNFSYQIYCIPQVDWNTNRLDFGYDQNGSGSTLELFVTHRSADGGTWGTEQNVEGWLLVKNINGSYEMYEYSFKLDSSVKSHPYPNGNNPAGVWSEVTEAEGYLVVYINGRTFVAANNDLWHLIVIGWQ